MDDYINEVIFSEMGFKRNLIGTRYIIYFFNYVFENDIKIHNLGILKNIYPLIADYYKVEPCNVEKSIRYAIETTWDKMDSKVKDKMFSFYENRPTNLQFFNSTYDYIKKISNPTQNIETDNLIEYLCRLIKDDLRLNPQQLSCQYLIYYIDMVIKNGISIYELSPTKHIYPIIVKKFKTLPASIEGSIRYLIKASWSRMSEESKKELFCFCEIKPTNSEFIYGIYEAAKNYVNSLNKIKNYEELYKLRNDIKCLMQQNFGLYSQSHSGSYIQMFIEAILQVTQIEKLTDEMYDEIILSLGEKYGFYCTDYTKRPNSEYVKNGIELSFLRLIRNLYDISDMNGLLKKPENKQYIKTYLNVLSQQVKK